MTLIIHFSSISMAKSSIADLNISVSTLKCLTILPILIFSTAALSSSRLMIHSIENFLCLYSPSIEKFASLLVKMKFFRFLSVNKYASFLAPRSKSIIWYTLLDFEIFSARSFIVYSLFLSLRHLVGFSISYIFPLI